MTSPSGQFDANTTQFATQADLVTILGELFSDNFTFYFKAHAFHWNVLGDDFPQYHSFYGDIYEKVWGRADDIAEWMRRFDAFAPQSLQNVGQLDAMTVTDVQQGIQILMTDSEAFVMKLKAASVVATNLNEQGVLNFFAELMDEHQKLQWMLRSILVVTP